MKYKKQKFTSMAVSVRLDKRIAEELEKIAETTDRTKTYLINKALDQFLGEYADYQVALDRLRDKDDQIVSSSEFRKLLD